jgi:hypothetical protein
MMIWSLFYFALFHLLVCWSSIIGGSENQFDATSPDVEGYLAT